ncbi:RNA polymerase sigma factor [Pigmentiphaga sp.]|uniref:RNA polymerase sigma factor n=1 Tax=Pigmentiphaga sp. TaxID=1977564 RepID=UPI00128D8D41|nr:RNA polymerase sigma factor [Pigmentiphaga sp.]MPS26602.1 RNA polymerase sigma factor [Alcaligenaceae bacterium SAGV5]MPS53628.1 RNA polymerase sigma factor [Alcaligenaceae bacterium SAGV3]MPT57951.1 RNA polymerase sigma factor [Alcaligenaceae bacterium]
MSEEVRILLLEYLSRHYGDLRRRLARHLRNPELADDALHDTWLRVHRLHDQAPVLNPRGFLLRMSVNVALNNLRSHSSIVPGPEVEALLDVADQAPGPEQTVGARAEMAALLEIIRRMPERRRDVLLLVRWEGMAQKEVARRLGVSLRTVELELKRANDYCAARMAERNK